MSTAPRCLCNFGLLSVLTLACVTDCRGGAFKVCNKGSLLLGIATLHFPSGRGIHLFGASRKYSGWVLVPPDKCVYALEADVGIFSAAFKVYGPDGKSYALPLRTTSPPDGEEGSPLAVCLTGKNFEDEGSLSSEIWSKYEPPCSSGKTYVKVSFASNLRARAMERGGETLHVTTPSADKLKDLMPFSDSVPPPDRFPDSSGSPFRTLGVPFSESGRERERDRGPYQQALDDIGPSAPRVPTPPKSTPTPVRTLGSVCFDYLVSKAQVTTEEAKYRRYDSFCSCVERQYLPVLSAAELDRFISDFGRLDAIWQASAAERSASGFPWRLYTPANACRH
jgi:hypothetical protein